MHAPEGHVAVGWLLVEDLLTVIVLVIIPTIAQSLGLGSGLATGAEASHPLIPIAVALLKLGVLIAIVMLAGMRVIPWALMQVARLRSRELFTLTVLVFSVTMAAGAYMAFGASMALGAFLAGMMVAQSPVSHQAAADALPLRDSFAVIFFVSVGMIFNPAFLIQQPLLILVSLIIVLVVKPLSAIVIVSWCGWSVRTALTVAVGLSQVGEFSFIVADVASKHGMFSDAGRSALVATAMLTITLNPLLFRCLPKMESWVQRRPWLWNLLNARSDKKRNLVNESIAVQLQKTEEPVRRAVVIGFGPVGRSVNKLLRDAGMQTVVIDLNMDAINEANRNGQLAIFGDGTRDAVLQQAGVEQASHLVITLPQSSNAATIIAVARGLNPALRVLVRARYLKERRQLEAAGATAAVFEEGEAAVALARLVLADFGASRETMERTLRDLRLRLMMENVTNLSIQRVQHVMVPWNRVKRLTDTATLDSIRATIAEGHYSRWPVISAQTGHPIGYLLAKDLVAERSSGTEWVRLIRPLPVVTMDTDVHTLLTQLQEQGNTICLVESLGRPSGLVTIEDVLEQVVGKIADEYPKEQELTLQDALQRGVIDLDLQGTHSEEVIEELARLIGSDVLPADARIAERALEREHELSTDVGMGVAIPHARCPGLRTPVLAFGRSRQGVVFNVHSKEPVRLVFLLVTPDERPELQVVMLGKLASQVARPEIRIALFEATDQEQVLQALQE
jgi:CPA2 family monovalent cation:H+ antiporter-2